MNGQDITADGTSVVDLGHGALADLGSGANGPGTIVDLDCGALEDLGYEVIADLGNGVEGPGAVVVPGYGALAKQVTKAEPKVYEQPPWSQYGKCETQE
ncbi:hypothetical protein Q7C36_009490 [Tachysurus vachellii]|uniref:Uncharacterized protein n=1 Tax=Tachysurus vachellii TaxID=175792 RepID=A0AA88N262_TACVA|nr:hypothetical protein Q7C36_009490 [Tachysurus vachellii]